MTVADIMSRIRMHRILGLLIGLVLISSESKGEYNGWYIAFSMETLRGETIAGHIYIATAYLNPDSAKETAYAKEKFDQLDGNQNDTIIFYRERISYNYVNYGGKDTATTYSLLKPDFISVEAIKHLTILEMIPHSYLYGITSSLNLDDQVWIKTPPVQALNEGGYFCDWQIFIHEKDDEILKIIDELIKYNQAYEAKVKELEEIMKSADGEEYYEAEDGLDIFLDQIDDDKAKIIDKFDGHKVVVITFCSC